MCSYSRDMGFKGFSFRHWDLLAAMTVVSVFLVNWEKDFLFSSGEACPHLAHLGGLLAVAEAEPCAGLQKTSEDAF